MDNGFCPLTAIETAKQTGDEHYAYPKSSILTAMIVRKKFHFLQKAWR